MDQIRVEIFLLENHISHFFKLALKRSDVKKILMIVAVTCTKVMSFPPRPNQLNYWATFLKNTTSFLKISTELQIYSKKALNIS